MFSYLHLKIGNLSMSFLAIISICIPFPNPSVNTKDLLGVWKGTWNRESSLITFKSDGSYLFAYDSTPALIFRGHWYVKDNQLFITEEVEVNRLVLFEWIFERVNRKRLKFKSKETILELVSLVKIKTHD